MEPYFSKINTRCQTCEGFLTDWLQLPLAANEPAILRWKTIRDNAPEIARQIFRIYTKIPASYRPFIVMTQSNKFRANVYSLGISKMVSEMADGEYLLQSIEFYVGKEELEILKTMLEDLCTVKKGVVRKWMGQWMIKTWDILQSVHMEHRKLAGASYTGPAHGMCAHKASTGSILPVYKTSIHSLLGISEEALLKKVALEEMYDLYDL